jgi:ATP/maltotriose-dependent transcriptional regulator MalT
VAPVLTFPKKRDPGESTISTTTTRRKEHLEQPISKDVGLARGLLTRQALLQALDDAVARRITVISAPAGSGKTSLLRAWVDRSTDVRRVASVSVERDEQDAQRFWCSVLDALRGPAAPIDPAASAGLDGDQLVDRVRSELAEHEAVVLIIDDLHELRSAEALVQLERLLAHLPSSARVVLSSRRDQPVRWRVGCVVRAHGRLGGWPTPGDDFADR